MKPRVTTVITDLDNTLYDWVAMWAASFPAMLRVLVQQSGIAQDVIEREARAIHQKHGTSEYSFLIEALPCLRAKHPQGNLAEIYADAIAAYRQARDSSLALYPSVLETLSTLKTRGVRLVGYTDSRAFYTRSRVQKLGLDGVLDVLYSPADHDLPAGTTAEMVRSRPPEAYELKVTKHRHTPEGEAKPNPMVLADIISEVGADHAETIYAGDSLMKDVLMAQQAKVIDVYAEYGVVGRQRPEYEILRRVSHWTDEEVEREKQLKARLHVHPSYTLRERFGELIEWFDFQPFKSREAA
jgi:phosphoglycolate phosphatase